MPSLATSPSTELTLAAAAAAKLLQSCPTLCDPIDCNPPGSPIPGILQARTLEWVAISFCDTWKWKNKVKSLRRVRLLVTPWTAAHQAPLSMGFSRQGYWSGVPLPSPELTLESHVNICHARNPERWFIRLFTHAVFWLDCSSSLFCTTTIDHFEDDRLSDEVWTLVLDSVLGLSAPLHSAY